MHAPRNIFYNQFFPPSQPPPPPWKLAWKCFYIMHAAPLPIFLQSIYPCIPNFLNIRPGIGFWGQCSSDCCLFFLWVPCHSVLRWLVDSVTAACLPSLSHSTRMTNCSWNWTKNCALTVVLVIFGHKPLFTICVINLYSLAKVPCSWFVELSVSAVSGWVLWENWSRNCGFFNEHLTCDEWRKRSFVHCYDNTSFRESYRYLSSQTH